MQEAVHTFVPYSGYPQDLPTASGEPLTVVIDACDPFAFRKLWGMTLLERNLRMVERLGARTIHVLVLPENERLAGKRRFPALTEPSVQAATERSIQVIAGLVEQLDGPVLVLEAIGLYDRRLIARLWQTATPAAGTQGSQALEATALLIRAGLLNGVAKETTRTWRGAAASLLQVPGVRQIDLDAMESRVSLLRKTVPPEVIRIDDAPALRRADRYLRALAGKGINDLMGEFVHPPIEFFLTRLAAHTPLTPNAVSYLIVLLSLAGLYFFAVGQFWTGIAVNLVRGVVDGVDGKLARLTLRESKNGNLLDHGTDTAYLPLLFLALGYALSGGDPLSTPAIATYILQVCYWFNRVFSSWFRTFLGVDESEFRALDRVVRRFQPKRNNFILITIGAMLCDAPLAGLYGITALTACFLLYRVARLDQEGRALARGREDTAAVEPEG